MLGAFGMLLESVDYMADTYQGKTVIDQLETSVYLDNSPSMEG